MIILFLCLAILFGGLSAGFALLAMRAINLINKDYEMKAIRFVIECVVFATLAAVVAVLNLRACWR